MQKLKDVLASLQETTTSGDMPAFQHVPLSLKKKKDKSKVLISVLNAVRKELRARKEG